MQFFKKKGEKMRIPDLYAVLLNHELRECVVFRKIPWILFLFLLPVWIFGQNDLVRLEGGSIVEGQTKEFKIYLTDVSNTGLDTGGAEVIGYVGLKVTFPPGLISAAHAERSGVLATQGVLFDLDFFDEPNHTFQWNIGFLPPLPAFVLDHPAPGEEIGTLTLTAAAGTAGQSITWTPNPIDTELRNELGDISYSLDNGLLTVDLPAISITSSGGGSLPQIASFQANPSVIAPGESTTLSWVVNQADSVLITPDSLIGSVPSTGSQTLSPSATTQFTLVATNEQGTTQQSITVTVDEGTAPIIEQFALSPTTILAGEEATLSWQVLNADTVTLTPPGQTVSGTGSTRVSPTENTTYSLEASNAQGTVSQQVMLTVTPVGSAPTITLFSVSPTSIPSGETATLSWATENATTVTLNPGNQTLALSGNKAISPSETTVYQLSASNLQGEVTQQVTLQVSPVGSPKILVFSSDPDMPTMGETYRLVWETEGASSLRFLKNGALFDQSGLPSGTLSVRANEGESLVQWTLEAENASGTAQTSMEISFIDPNLRIDDFQASPNSPQRGEPVVLSWTANQAETLHLQPYPGNVTDLDQIELRVFSPTTFQLDARRGDELISAQQLIQPTSQPPGKTLVYPEIWTGSHGQTDLGLLNIGQDRLLCEIGFFEQSGLLVHAETNIVLQPFQTFTLTVDENLWSSEETLWAVVYEKNSSLSESGLRGWAVLRSEDREELMAYPASFQGDKRLFLPHIATDPQFYTRTAIANVSLTNELSFLADQNQWPLASFDGLGAAWLDMRETLSPTLPEQAWGEFASPDPIFGMERFGRRSQEGIAQGAAVGLDAEGGTTLIFPHTAKDKNTFWTGIVLVNPQSFSLDVMLELLDDLGNPLPMEPVTLAPSQKRTFLMDRQINQLNEGVSWIRVQGSAPLIGYMLFGGYPPSDFFSGFQSTKTLHTLLAFPHLEESRTENSWTGLAFVNPNPEAAALLVELRDKDATVMESQELVLESQHKRVLLISQLFTTPLTPDHWVLVHSSQPLAGFSLFGDLDRKNMAGILAIGGTSILQ
jgi:hypothetical protein